MAPRIFVPVLISAEISEKQELFDTQYRSLEHAIVNLIKKKWPSDERDDVCGIYDLTGEQVEKFWLLKEQYLYPIKMMEMNIAETYIEFLERRQQFLDNSVNQFSTEYEDL